MTLARLLVLLLCLLLTAPSVAAQADLAWEPLGGAPDDASASAVAPLVDGSLLLLSDNQVLRRPPGGGWIEVLRGERGTYLAASRGDRPLALAVLGETVFVSLDGGQTWRTSGLPAGGARLELSPAFDDDGTALYVGAGRLFQTRDGGVSWTELAPAAGQQVQRAVFSPDFATDRTLLVAAISGPFPSLLTDPTTSGPAADNEASAGLLISTDGGQSWRAPGPGPSVEETPYRHIQALEVSPAFAADHTIFAYAWGPRPVAPFMGGSARQWQGALFRSTDGGATWTPILSSGPPAFLRGHAQIALSPAFPLDDTLFVALTETGATPASSGCRVLRTVDAGATWREVVKRGSYEACLGVVISPRYSDDRVVLTGKTGWTASRDGGLTWESLGRPGLSAPPVFAGDLWLYAAGRGGAWRLPPFPDRTDLPDCSIAPAGGFGRLWRANDALRADLGCPLEPEQQVSALTQGGRDLQEVQPDPDGDWYTLDEDGTLHALGAGQPADDGHQLVDVVRQRYEGGVLIWNPRPPATILALDTTSGRWRSFPDVP